MMKRSIVFVLLAIVMFVCHSACAQAPLPLHSIEGSSGVFLTNTAYLTNPPAEGGELPAIDLAVPQNTEHQEYLGIGGSKTFTIPDIKAEVVLIEIFSMY